MALNIKKMDDGRRIGVKAALFGPPGIGKTSQVWTLPADRTLMVDMESGDLSLKGWTGDKIDVFEEATRTGASVWDMMRAIACWLGGPSPIVGKPELPYSREHYAYVCSQLGDPAAVLAKYDVIFVDSITVASRAAFSWCQSQPEAVSEKTGKPDIRGAYGLLGREMVAWLTQWQHIADKDVIMVGILDQVKDDYGRLEWKPQIMGGATGAALPGIFDEIVSMVEFPATGDAKEPYRAFVCKTLNEWGYPAKDRSSLLSTVEEPNLGKLLRKIRAGGIRPDLMYDLPKVKDKEDKQ